MSMWASMLKIGERTIGISMRTQQEYLENPEECPNCGSQQVDWGTPFVDDLAVVRENTCETCSAEWTETYTLHHFEVQYAPPPGESIVESMSVKLEKLTPKELDIKIAELRGWRLYEFERSGKTAQVIFSPDYGTLPSKREIPFSELDLKKLVFSNNVPNFSEDVRLAYQLESEVHPSEKGKYMQELLIVLDAGSAADMTEYDWSLVHATPRQRCLAWLRYMMHIKE